MRFCKAILLLAIVVCSAGATSITVTNQTITTTTWDVDTVFVSATNTTVSGNDTLTIKEGTTVYFTVPAFARFLVYGTLQILGTKEKPVRFYTTNSNFSGIRFMPLEAGITRSSVVQHAVFEKMESDFGSKDTALSRGAVHCGTGHSVLFNNCQFNGINYADYYGAVYVHSGSNVVVDSCEFVRNFAQQGSSIFSMSGNNSITIKNSTFKHNLAYEGGALWFSGDSKIRIENSLFYKDSVSSFADFYNRGGAIFLKGVKDIDIVGSLFIYNRVVKQPIGKGGAIYSEDCSPRIINCTFAHNVAYKGGAVYLGTKTAQNSPLIVNSAFQSNGLSGVTNDKQRDTLGATIFIDSASTPHLSHTIVDDSLFDFKTKPYAGKMENVFIKGFTFESIGSDIPDTVPAAYQMKVYFGDEEFYNGGTADTTGLGLPKYDILGRERILEGRVDIGAVEYVDPETSVKQQKKLANLSLAPGRYDVMVYSLRGQKMAQFPADIAGVNLGTVVANRFSSGIYLVTLVRSGQQVWSQKVTIK